MTIARIEDVRPAIIAAGEENKARKLENAATDAKATQAKERIGLTPFDFGAVGDGVTDDRPAFVAMNAAGGKVYLPKPPVAYTLSSPLDLTNVAVTVDPAATWSQATANGALGIPGGKTTGSGSKITRFPDRVFVGKAATRFAGNGFAPDQGTSFFSNPANGPAYLAMNSAVVVEAGPTQYAITANVLTSQATGAAGIALGSAVVNDKASGRAWGWIAEMQHEAGALNSNGFELAVKNKSGTSSTYTPYLEVPGVFGGRIVGGGDPEFGGAANAPNTAALIVIRNNYGGNIHGSWNTGIVFGANSLTGTDGTAASAAYGTAMSMARMHALDWHAPANGLGARMSSRVTDGGKAMGQFFADDAIIFQSMAGGAGVVRMQHVANAVNYLQISNNSTGGPVILTATGTDANINVRLNPRGSGRVQFGYSTAAATTPANFTADRYLQVLDSTGNAYLIPCRAAPW